MFCVDKCVQLESKWQTQIPRDMNFAINLQEQPKTDGNKIWSLKALQLIFKCLYI